MKNENKHHACTVKTKTICTALLRQYNRQYLMKMYLGSLVLRLATPTVHWSYGPLVLRLIGPMVVIMLYSETCLERPPWGYGRLRQVVVEKSEIVKKSTIAFYILNDAESNGMHLSVGIFPSFFHIKCGTVARDRWSLKNQKSWKHRPLYFTFQTMLNRMVYICQSEFFRHFSYKMWYGRSTQVVVKKSEIVKTSTIALYVSNDAELNGMHL